MFLAQDNDVVQTLAPDRSDQPFGKAILPGTQSACDDRTVDAIPVPDHVARSLVPGECLRYLTRDPHPTRLGHVFGDTRLPDLKPQPKQLAVNAWPTQSHFSILILLLSTHTSAY